MAAGLWIWDAQGNPLVDLTTRMSKYIGQVQINGGAGSINVSLPAGNALWACLFISNDNDKATYPSISISGSTLSWSAASISGIIMYGAY